MEVTNTGPETVDLQGWRPSGGVDLPCTSPTLLVPGEFMVVAEDMAVLRTATRLSGAFGPWSGRLSNGGERLVLQDPSGNTVDDVTCDDDQHWPVEPGGDGPSRELLNPALPNQYPSVRRSSLLPFGTPEAVNTVFESQPGPVVFDTIHGPPCPVEGGPSPSERM